MLREDCGECLSREELTCKWEKCQGALTLQGALQTLAPDSNAENAVSPDSPGRLPLKDVGSLLNKSGRKDQVAL